MCKKILTILLPIFFTVSASAEVNTAWISRYNGPIDSMDFALAMVVDDSGNVYVTGPSGGPGPFPNRIPDYFDYATVKYYPNGDMAWVRRYDGPTNSRDEPMALAVDHKGNIYITGRSAGVGTYPNYFDIATIKYYPNGDTAWVRRYDGPVDSVDEARAVVVDDFGNVYVTGYSYGLGTYIGYVTIKYYPEGDTAWVRRYNGLSDREDNAFAIAMDGSGNVYVTGLSFDYETSYDCATIKYYPNGDTAWVRRYGGPVYREDWGNAIAVDDSGNVYVTGLSFSDWLTYRDIVTIKYYPDGDTAWLRKYNGPQNYSEDIGQDLVVDNAGNVYVTGESWNGGRDPDYVTIKYNPDGSTAWVKRYNGPGNWDDEAKAIAIDDSGNVYVTGGSYGTGTEADFVTIKYVQASILRGDANGDGVIDVGDVVYLINYLFKSGSAPNPWATGDANCDQVVNVGDVVYLINYLFKGGSPPSC